MTVATTRPRASDSTTPVMRGITWDTYQRLRRELDDSGSNIRITYDRGRMVLMSPLPLHDKWKTLTRRLVETLGEELDIPTSGYGSTTWQRPDLARSLEADECYYVQHADALRGKMEFDLTIDPPPDLAIEIVVTHDPIDKPDIYASLGVPELWRYDGRAMRLLVLNASTATYELMSTSLAFPGFKPAELHRFLAMYPNSLDSEVVHAFRQWVRSTQRGNA